MLISFGQGYCFNQHSGCIWPCYYFGYTVALKHYEGSDIILNSQNTNHTLKMFSYLSKENLEYLYDLLISLRCHWNKYWQRNTNNFMGYLNILHYRYLSVKYTSASNIITFKIFMYIPLTGVCKKIVNWTNWGRETYLNKRDPIWTAVLYE